MVGVGDITTALRSAQSGLLGKPASAQYYRKQCRQREYAWLFTEKPKSYQPGYR